eukprot:m.23857 g.23857  ORF g.23857 m.23857 type:complete len:287 (-) comp14378_c0_seq1:157-1017(-)
MDSPNHPKRWTSREKMATFTSLPPKTHKQGAGKTRRKAKSGSLKSYFPTKHVKFATSKSKGKTKVQLTHPSNVLRNGESPSGAPVSSSPRLDTRQAGLCKLLTNFHCGVTPSKSPIRHSTTTDDMSMTPTNTDTHHNMTPPTHIDDDDNNDRQRHGRWNVRMTLDENSTEAVDGIDAASDDNADADVSGYGDADVDVDISVDVGVGCGVDAVEEGDELVCGGWAPGWHRRGEGSPPKEEVVDGVDAPVELTRKQVHRLRQNITPHHVRSMLKNIQSLRRLCEEDFG